MGQSFLFGKAMLVALASTALGGVALSQELVPLGGAEGEVGDEVLEAFLSPAEFKDRHFLLTIRGQAAEYCLDLAVSTAKPSATLVPERLTLPTVANLALEIEGGPIELRFERAEAAEALQNGFEVRLVLAALGERFFPVPRFVARLVSAEVVPAGKRRPVLRFLAPSAPPVCLAHPKARQPTCDLDTISRDARDIALSPDGELAALAIGGLRPRIEVYDISRQPRLLWQALFPLRSGAAASLSFSPDQKWLTAITGRGQMHRFAAASGQHHLAMGPKGRVAKALRQGQLAAAAGTAGDVAIWFIEDGTALWRLPLGIARGRIARLAVSGDGRRLATLDVSKDRNAVRFWDVSRRAAAGQLDLLSDAAAELALDHLGATLYVALQGRGLFRAELGRGATLRPFAGEVGASCQGQLAWLDEGGGSGALLCVAQGSIWRIGNSGRADRLLDLPREAGDMVIASALDGRRIAAVGGGHLLVWRGALAAE